MNVFKPAIPPLDSAVSSLPVATAVFSAVATAFPSAWLFVAVVTDCASTPESLAVPPIIAALTGSVFVASPVSPPCTAPPTMSASFPVIAPPVMLSTSLPASVDIKVGPSGVIKLAACATAAETPAAAKTFNASLGLLMFPDAA